jgi:hypothetical protein
MHGAEWVAQVLVEAGGDDAEAQNTVSDEHVLENGEFFAQQIIALLL